MKNELNWMLNDLKENVYGKPKRTVLIILIFSFTISIVFAIANLYLFILMTIVLYGYWCFDAYRHCRKNKKKESKAIEDKTFDPVV